MNQIPELIYPATFPKVQKRKLKFVLQFYYKTVIK